MPKSGSKENEMRAATPMGIESVAPALPTFDFPDSGADTGTGLTRGTSIGRYLVLERLGAGAMGVVYAAYDQDLDRKIAIKLLRARDGRGDEAKRRERLIREAKAIAKLSHPNVVGIFDVGVHDGQVFLAMEHLGGGTLRDWLAAERRPWREIVKMFIDVGQGLAAAHAEGLIHRDFKPDNVLLDKQGNPKVADFGLVRLRAGDPEPPTQAIDVAETTHEEGADSPPGAAALDQLTRTGAIAGTPAYMAPEQFLGKPVDGRADQFAFCVALHEALFGERPFAGDTVMALAGAVTAERIRTPARSADVPQWVRRCVHRGLRANPAHRFVGFEQLLSSLKTDPGARLRRRVGMAAALIAIAATVAGVQRRAEHRRSEFERGIAVRLADGGKAWAEAQAVKGQLQSLRSRAFAQFDAHAREDGERTWALARTTSASLDSALDRAQRALEAALEMDSGRNETRRRLAEVLFERAALAELEFRRDDLARYVTAMDAVDTLGDHRRRWRQPGALSIRTSPAGAKIAIERYDLSGPTIASAPVGEMLLSPVTGRSLDPGSYRLTIEQEGHARVSYPVVMKRGESLSVDLALPARGELPEGFTYVAPGRFLYGDQDEDLRRSFLDAVPLHERHLAGFLIKAHETTFAEWIAFVSSLPPGEREMRRPHGSSIEGAVRVDRNWALQLDISRQTVKAAAGEKLVYPKRVNPDLAAQDWLKMPVVGVSVRDIAAYVHWLRGTGKVPGARFCTDAEWERAARGADERAYPASMVLNGADANVDVTYGRTLGAYGPDEVGRHPLGQSPFGVFDMAGNVWEIVMDEQVPDSFVARGGGYYHDLRSARTTNRQTIETELRNHFIGVRVCADWHRVSNEARP